MDLAIWWKTSKNNRAAPLYYVKLSASFQSHLRIFCPLWPQNLTDDLENNRAHFLSYLKLCASFHSHLSIQNGVTVLKRQIWVKIGDFFVACDLEIWQMTLKTIGHLFYAPSSFMYHFIALWEIKMKLQSGNTKFGSKSAIFCPVWPWNLTDDIEKQ